ncbi:MAG: hypothetical protein AB1508_16720 [Pseudomonadota bacterium]
MSDAELRGLVLQVFYEVRHEVDWFSLKQLAEKLEDFDFDVLGNICDQLGEKNLITWKPLRSGMGIAAGMGRITSDGIDVLEGTASAPIAITLYDHSVRVSGSSNVQVGGGNVQNVNFDIGKLVAAIDHSQAGEREKAEAKSLLQKFTENKLVMSLLTTLFTAGAAH